MLHNPNSYSPDSDNQELLPTDTKVELVHQGNWLSFGHVNFTDPIHHKQWQWEFVRRNRPACVTVDVVDILAILKKQGFPDSVILVAQYRPPVQKVCVEFPAGLVDGGESIATAAQRELLEETGYFGSEIYTSSAMFYDAGLSDSNMQLVHIEVDGNHPANQKPRSQLEADEWSMKTFVFPLNNLLQCLTDLQSQSYQIDAKLFTYAYAIKMAQHLRF